MFEINLGLFEINPEISCLNLFQHVWQIIVLLCIFQQGKLFFFRVVHQWDHLPSWQLKFAAKFIMDWTETNKEG